MQNWQNYFIWRTCIRRVDELRLNRYTPTLWCNYAISIKNWYLRFSTKAEKPMLTLNATHLKCKANMKFLSYVNWEDKLRLCTIFRTAVIMLVLVVKKSLNKFSMRLQNCLKLCNEKNLFLVINVTIYWLFGMKNMSMIHCFWNLLVDIQISVSVFWLLWNFETTLWNILHWHK